MLIVKTTSSTKAINFCMGVCCLKKSPVFTCHKKVNKGQDKSIATKMQKNLSLRNSKKRPEAVYDLLIAFIVEGLFIIRSGA